MDESIRKAKELKASEFDIEGFDVNDGSLLEAIRAALVPDAHGITAELDKLNFYSSGCHFASHYDTPRGEGFFGTLIVVLPVLHVGGELTITRPGTSNTSVSTAIGRKLVPGHRFDRANVAYDSLQSPGGTLLCFRVVEYIID